MSIGITQKFYCLGGLVSCIGAWRGSSSPRSALCSPRSISYIKSGRANSLEDASQLYVDGVLRKYNWLLRGLDGLRNS